MKNRVKKFIEENFLFEKDSLEDDRDLFESGIVDSFGFVELLSFIEKELGVNFKRSEIEIENFNTVNHIVSSIKKVKEEKE